MKFLNNMKTILFFISVFFVSSFFSQNLNIKIEGEIVNSTFKEAALLNWGFKDSLVFQKSFTINENGSFSLSTSIPSEDYYVIAFPGNEFIPLILRKNSDIKIYADGTKLNSFCNIVNSDESQQLLFFKRESESWKKTLDSAELILKSDPTKQKELSDQITPKYYSFRQFQQNYVSKNANTASLFPVLEHYPIKRDFQNYEMLLMQLQKAFPQSSMVIDLFAKYKEIKVKMAAENPLAIGNLAPDFSELALDRKSKLKLSDFRGKVVLIDFWASWCAPCRKENPNVVALYNKYKDKGFTVISVSLDSKEEKWKEAIKKDNLIWPNHVSDLGGWRSKVSKLYGVSSIPFTVLIDENGKIISTNLRGSVLENTLSKLFDK